MVSGFVGSGELPPESGDGEFDKGFEAYYRRDYETALAEWMPLAEQGVLWAKHNIAVMYHNGEGVTQDIGVAKRLFDESGGQKLASDMTFVFMEIKDPREK